MDQIWYSRVRTAARRVTTNWIQRLGIVHQDLNGGSEVFLTAASGSFTPPSGPFTFFQRVTSTSDDYSSFTPLSVSGINADQESFFPFVPAGSGGGKLAFFDSRNASFYINSAFTNIGYSYTTDFSTLVSITGAQLPNVQAIYPAGGGGGTPSSFTGATMVGMSLSGGGDGTSPAPSPDFTYIAPIARISTNQITTGSTTGNYATATGHMVKVDNTTKAVSWVRSGYPTGMAICMPPGTAAGMGKAVFPLDMVIGPLPAPSSYTTPSGGSFPGIQAEVGEIVFWKPGCIKTTADVTITNGGSGATRGSIPNFNGYVYLMPPPDPVSGLRNSLPLVLAVTVVSGVVTSISSVSTATGGCLGAGFPAGTATYTMTWDQGDRMTGTVSVLPGAAGITYAFTTAPQFTITFRDTHAPIRYITMKEPGDGYFFRSGAWDGVTQLETPFNNSTRSYLWQGNSSQGTVPWTSASTGESGTLNASKSYYTGIAYGAFDMNSAIISGFPPNRNSWPKLISPKSNLLLTQRMESSGGGGIPSQYFNSTYGGASGWFSSLSPQSHFRTVGQMMLSNGFPNIQYIDLPDLKYQPGVPYYGILGPANWQPIYTDVPSTDPFITFLDAYPTGVGSNMYVFASHSYGEYNATTPSSSVFRHKILMYHLDPGPDLDDIAEGVTWTLMYEFPEFTTTIPVNVQLLTNSRFFIPRGSPRPTGLYSNADFQDGLPPTEGVVGYYTNYGNTGTPEYFYFTFTSETSVTLQTAPTSLTWTPDGSAPLAYNPQYDSINKRWVLASGMNGVSPAVTWPNYTGTGPAFILLGTGESLWATNPTVTFLSDAQTGDIWPD
jgi:hypothetical protein